MNTLEFTAVIWVGSLLAGFLGALTGLGGGVVIDIGSVIAFLNLERFRDVLIANLPYGVRKVVELGRALCIEPKLLLLDEPSSGLNVEETEGMGFWIEDIKKDLGITVIMVEHDMNLVRQVSDRVMALNYGKVIALGTSEEVQTHPEVVRAYIGGEAAA